MAIDSVSSATTTALPLQAPLRPRAEEALRTEPARAERAAGESPGAQRAGDAQGAARSPEAARQASASQRPAEPPDASATTDGQTRPTLNAAGQTVGRIVDTTA